MPTGGWCVDSADGLAPDTKLASRPLPHRLLRLRPETLHPIVNDCETDGGVASEAPQAHQVVELFVYAGDESTRQTDSVLFVGRFLSRAALRAARTIGFG